MSTQRDTLADSLEQAADVAERGAREQGEAAATARDAARRHRTDPAAGADAATGAVRRVLGVLLGNAERLGATAGSLRRAWAAALAAEGLSLRAIGERLGVSHQRVSVLLRGHHDDPAGRQRP